MRQQGVSGNPVQEIDQAAVEINMAQSVVHDLGKMLVIIGELVGDESVDAYYRKEFAGCAGTIGYAIQQMSNAIDWHTGTIDLALAEVRKGITSTEETGTMRQQQTFTVQGDAMAPEFIDNDQVHYDPDREPRHGQFVAARIGETVVVRQYIKHPAGDYLEPLNEQHQTIPMNGGDVHVLGVVVEASRLYPPAGAKREVEP